MARELRAVVVFVGVLLVGSTGLSACSRSSTARPVLTPTTIASAPTSTARSTTSVPTDFQPSFPIRAAFYYPWFPEAWTQHGTAPYSKYTPTLGFYKSDDANVLAKHVAMMRAGGLNAGIASWWGRGTPTDQRIPALLAAASGTPFRWALYYEQEGYADPSVSEIQLDLTYIAAHYGSVPTYLRVNGRPVLFVYASGSDGCTMADRWSAANVRHAFYIVLKAFARYRTCASQPDAWHQYAPAVATDSRPGSSFTISPGFWKADESAPRLVRDPNRWATNVQQMIASGAPWQLVTTFNEWGEGTAIESSSKWNTTYLDILAEYLHPVGSRARGK